MTLASASPSALPHSRAAELLAAGQLTAAVASAQSELTALDAAPQSDPRWQGLRAALLETLGTAQFKLSQATEAEHSLLQAIEQAANVLPAAAVARIRMTLCAVLEDAGREADAMPVYEAAIADFISAQPPETMAAARLRNNLALGYKRAGKFALAEQHYLLALEAMESALGKQHEEVAALYNNIGSLYYSAGFALQAKETFDEALAVRRAIHGDTHPDVAQSLINLGSASYETGDHAQAVACFEEGVAILEKLLPEKARSYETATDDFIALLGALGRDHQAADLQEKRNAALAMS
jgi:tetratricopeptide (TPR) repeat protein